MNETEEEIRKNIVSVITALLPDVKIILYGSRARGTHRETSDYDIALDGGAPINYGEFVQVSNVIEALTIPQKIDVVDFHAVSQRLKDQILKYGVVWKQ